MWCRVLLGVIAISYLICVLVLSFMQKEDLDVGLLKRVQRRNIDVNQIENVQKGCFIKRNLDKKASNEATESAVIETTTGSISDQLEKQHEDPAKQLTRALEKLKLASILECLKHIQVTITTSPTTVKSTTRKSVTPSKLLTVITKDFTKKAQYDFSTEKRLKNMFKVLETNSNKDVTTMLATTENYKANRKAIWNVTVKTQKQRTVTSPSASKKKVTRPTTIDIEDVDSKEIERMTKILYHYKNRKKHLPKKTTTKIMITTMKPTTTKQITEDSKEDERLSKIFAEYENRQNYFEKTKTSLKPTTIEPTITDDSGEEYRLSKILAEYENIPKYRKKIITTQEPIRTTMEPTKTDDTEVDRLGVIFAEYENKKKYLLETKTSLKPSTTEPTTTDESIEVKRLSRLIAEFEIKQEHLKKSTATSVRQTTTTEPVTTTNFKEIERLSKLLVEYEIRQDNLDTTTTTIKAPTTSNESKEIERISKLLAQYSNLKKTTTSLKPTTADLTTIEPSEIEYLRKLLEKYENRQDLSTKATLTTTIEPITMESTIFDSSKETERLRKLLVEYETQELLKKTTSTTEPIIIIPTTTSDYKEIERLKELLAKYEKRQELSTTKLITAKEPITTTKPTANATTDSIEIERLRKLLAEYKNRQKLLKSTTTTKEPITIITTTIDDSKKIERLSRLLDNYETKKIITVTEPIKMKSTTVINFNEIERLSKLLAEYETQEMLKKTTSTTEPIITIPTTTSDYKEIERLKELLAKYEKRQELSTTKLITAKEPITTTKPTANATTDSIEIERLRKLLAEYKNRQKLLKSTTTTKEPITIKTTTIDDSKKIERLSRLLDNYETKKIITVTEPIKMKSTTVINFNEIERLSKLLAEYETQELLKKITTIEPTTVKPTIIINSNEIQRLSILLAEYESQENLKKTTVAPTTIDATKEIERLSKLLDGYRNLHETTTSTTIKPITSVNLEQIITTNKTVFKDNVQLTDSRLHNMMIFWDNFIKTSTPFELTSSTPKTTTTKATTIIISDIWKTFNWYKPAINTEHTTEYQTIPTTTHAIENLNVNTKEIKHFRELISGFKNSRKIGNDDQPKPKEKKIINKAVKRIEHYLKIIKNRQNLVSDTQTDYKDATDTEVEENQTIEVKYRKPHRTNYILKDRRTNPYETTTNIEKDIIEKIYEPKTNYEKYREVKYTPPDVLIDKTIDVKDKISTSTDFIQNYRRGNIYETTTNIEKQLTEKVYKPTSHEKDKEEIKDLPPKVLKDIAKNIKEQILNDLRKEMFTNSTNTKIEASPTLPVAMPSEQHDIVEEKQEATKAIVKFIKIIEQFTAEKGTNLPSPPTSTKIFAANKAHEYPAPINILYQHTNLVPPLKGPEIAQPYNSQQKNVINKKGEHKNRKIELIIPNNDLKSAVKSNGSPVVLNSFPGEIPPLQVPHVPLSEPIVVNKNTISTTKPPELHNSDTPERYDLNYYRNNNKRDELKKIRDSLAEYSNTANVIKNNDDTKPRVGLDESTKHSLNRNILNVLNQKIQEPKKEEDFKRYTHNVPLEIKNNAPQTEFEFRKFTREKYHTTQSPIASEYVNEENRINMPVDIQGIKGFHERLEGIEQWPKDPNAMIEDLKQEESRASALQMTSRHQLPLSHMKKMYDDSSFKNFIKTQQKVNEILEEILASRAKARSTEAT